jgi:putative membrane protein
MKVMILYGAVVPLALAAAASAGTPTRAVPQTEPMAPAQMTMPRDAMGYARSAGAGDLYEIESSRLAQQKAATGAVRQFGQMMIEHHTMTTQQLTSAARAAGMTPPPPALEPRQQKMIDELRGLSGAQFDAAYLRQQRAAHQEALALHSGYAENGDNPALRKVASAAVPIVQRHSDLLANLPKG